jgi:plasmid stability protein
MEENRRKHVATLNIKNLPDALYRKLRARARRERRSVSQEVTRILERAVDEPEPHSLLELRGLGRELWTGIEAAEHVDAERRSWD